MKIYKEDSIKGYGAWSGAVDTVDTLTDEQAETLESIFEDIYPDGIGETELNDILWFENDWIAEMLGFDDWEALERHNNGEEEETEETDE